MRNQYTDRLPDYDRRRLELWSLVITQDATSEIVDPDTLNRLSPCTLYMQLVSVLVWFNQYRTYRSLIDTRDKQNEVKDISLATLIEATVHDAVASGVRRIVGGPRDCLPIDNELGGTWSLYSLMSDMKSRSGLLTRNNLFAWRGVEIDKCVAEKKYLEWVHNELVPDKVSYVPHDIPDPSDTERLHKLLDAIGFIEDSHKREWDRLNVDNLMSVTPALIKARELVNKQVAHIDPKRWYSAPRMSIREWKSVLADLVAMIRGLGLLLGGAHLQMQPLNTSPISDLLWPIFYDPNGGAEATRIWEESWKEFDDIQPYWIDRNPTSIS